MKLKLFIVLLLFSSVVVSRAENERFFIETSPHRNMIMLENELRRILLNVNAQVYFGAYHVQSGKSIFINGDQKYPLASTSKLLFATTFLSQVENNKHDLNENIAITSISLRPYSEFSNMMINPKMTLDAKSVLESMLIVSENTASDIIFDKIGKREGVNVFLNQNSISRINVSRSILDLIYSIQGLDPLGKNYKPINAHRKAKMTQSKEREEKARKWFFQDKKDTATAKAYLSFLKKLVKKELLSEKNTQYVLNVMTRCKNKRRIAGLLPGIAIANKTGSFSNLSNDVGVITLPYDKGELIIVASVIEEHPERLPDSKQFKEDREKWIALLSKTVYDFMLYQ